MSAQAFYFNEYGIIHTREQWIDIFEYQLRTGGRDLPKWSKIVLCTEF